MIPEVTTSKTLAVMLAARPDSRTCLLLNRWANLAPRSEVVMAVTTWGRNMAPRITCC